jgi:hypothetical protein
VKAEVEKAGVGTLMVGCIFSLWRAVFLAHEGVTPEANLDDAVKYLDRVIRTNAINFSDDLAQQGWAFSYYANNARFRLRLICEREPGYRAALEEAGLYDSLRSDQPLRSPSTKTWDDCYNALRTIFSLYRIKWEQV